MKRELTRQKATADIYHYRDGQRIDSPPTDVRGDLSDVWGDLTGVRGDLTGVRGNLTGVWGDLGDCELTAEERAAGVDIASIVLE